MNKKLLTLMKQRYGKAVIAAIIVIILFYILTSFNFISGWHSYQEYYNSDEFIESYESGDYYDNVYDEDGNLLNDPLSVEEYRDSQLYIFMDGVSSTRGDVYDKEYIADHDYYYQTMPPSFLNTVLFLFIGALIFFIDLKTSFNTFLFSSGISRKQIFLGKLLCVALPILLAYMVGTLIQLGWIYTGIPEPYMNSTLAPLLSSTINNWFLAFYYLSIGSFIGVLLGNLVFGPLTAFVFSLLLTAFPLGVDEFMQTVKGVNQSVDFYFTDFFRDGLFKQMASWQAWLAFALVGAIFLLIAYKAYQKVSLEHNGQYLLIPKWRLPIFLFMAIFTNFVLNTAMSNPIRNYQYNVLYADFQTITLTPYITQLVVQIIIITLICWLVVYSSSIRSFYQRKREQRLNRLPV